MRKNFINYIGTIKMLAAALLVFAFALQSKAQITVTATAGTLGPTVYTQLRLAFNAINAGTHQGAITISVTANTVETAVAQLNQSALPSNYTSVLIKPAAAVSPSITGTIANNGIIYLRGATNVTIDGSNTVGGTTRDLTITNNGGGTSAAVRFGSASAALGATNNTLKNCNISLSGPTIGIAVTSGSGVTIFAAAEAPNSNNTIQNNRVSNAQTGIYVYGLAAALDANWNINANDVTGTGFAGIHVNNGTGTQIINNTISNVSINGATQTAGIVLSFNGANTTIARNKISNINNVNSAGAYGMYFDMFNTATNINVYNNFVLNATCPSGGTIHNNAHGIYGDSGNGFNIHHNTVQLANNSTGAFTNGAITFDPLAGAGLGIPAGAVNLRNNIFSNIQTAGNRYGIYSVAASNIYASIDYNDYHVTSGNLGFIAGVARTTIAQMQTGFGGNVNSIAFAPFFVSGTDLHLQGVIGNAPLIAGIPILTPAITTDIDNELRNTVIPTIGAHEILNKITYTNLPNTCNELNVTLNPVTIESKLGIVTTGANMPRIYYRKGAGTWYSAAGVMVSGTATNSVWTFVIDVPTIGGVVSGDVISYYVIAQTGAGPSLVFSTPYPGLVATNVNTVTTHPTTPNTYTVNLVTLNGLSTAANVCYSVSNQTASYTYTGTSGAPNQYTLTWAPAGPTAVPAFSPLPASPINVTVPAATPPGTYIGTIGIRNSASSCVKTYTVSLTVDAPLPIAGPSSICMSSTVVFSASPVGGTWTSTNTAVGTIGVSSGALTALSIGNTTLSYISPTGCLGTLNVTVAAPPSPITGTGAICPGATLNLTTASTGGTWSSFAPVVASVDIATGVVTGGVSGTTTISYNVAGCLPTTTVVTVNPIPNPITGTLYACKGFTTLLSTTSTGGTWISGTPTVATVVATSGLVTGVDAGSSVITYKFTSTGCFTTNTVNIFPLPDTISGGPLICQGASILLGNATPGGTWSSTLPGVVSVTSSGLATANSPSGTARISYIMATGCYATKVLTVSTAPTTISGGGQHIICTENTLMLSNGTPGGTWSSSNSAVATVSPTGLVTGITGGTVNITYITTVCSPVTYAITVNQTPHPITGGITVCNGGPTTTITDSTTGGVWAISGTAGVGITSLGVIGGLATANVTGLVTGGTYISTYTVPNGCFRNAAIVVDTIPAPITGPDSTCMGTTATLSTAATGGVWSSSNASIASIVATTGVVTGVNYGVVNITYAAVSGCSRTKPFKVRTPLTAAVSITRSPAVDTLCAGVPVTFTAHHVNGGATPGYQWQLFGVNIHPGVFADDSVYTYVPTHGDVISVFMMYSTDVCSYPAPAYASNSINVYPNVSPVVTITSSAPASVAFIGQVATFYAEVTTAGGDFTYQWYVDNELIPGATNSTFARPVYNNDTVFCMVNGQPACETGSIGKSNSIVVLADYLGVTAGSLTGANLALFPNPNSGTFTLSGSIGTAAATYDVVNVLGQVVAKGNVNAKNGQVNQVISLDAGLAAGTYILRVNSDTENKTFHFVVAE